ncbi:MAG: 50S ribosome-binding GTPase, partial [Muribaculaceae bacterium]|nr:50S ribosome-binding GTPase [Muribaculaceae bacterium]
MRLSDLKGGQTAVIVKILGHGAFRKRVMEMGFIKGREITAVLSAPLRDPVKYSIMGYEVSLRLTEARLIEVVPLDLFVQHKPEFKGTVESDDRDRHQALRLHPLNEINIALIGNPNCGKTSLFNIASGAQEHVGNYSGGTVDSKSGAFDYKGYRFNIVDLPGTYSLSAYSPEERYVRNYLKDHNPDVIVNVVDASNLERNLYLTTELIDMDHSMVIALNMFDELRKSGNTLDFEALGKMIGVPIVPTVSRTGEGIDQLFDTIIEVVERRNKSVRHVHVSLGKDLEEALGEIKEAIKRDKTVDQHFCPRYLGMKLIEGDNDIEALVSKAATGARIIEIRNRAVESLHRRHPQEEISDMVADEKYGFIAGALAETMLAGEQPK